MKKRKLTLKSQVFKMLLSGQKLTSYIVSKNLKTCDFRKIISILISENIPIEKKRITNVFGYSYKEYYLGRKYINEFKMKTNENR